MIFKELLRYICNYSYINHLMLIFFFSSRRRHTRLQGDWSSDVCSSDLVARKTAPPLPSVGFAPVRPMDIVRATYDFAAQHPEILNYVPCYCGCGSQGHKANESCFVARRDPRGNVLEWDTHGFGCTICVDVAREAMQMYSSGADVHSIRAAIERKWTPGNAAGKTPTPLPPAKK